MFVVGATYTQSWMFLGCPRQHSFTVDSICKNGSARGRLADADGKLYAKTFVKPEEFARWSRADS